jgi:serine/threonine protein kinase/Tfp pilus assembly protein PilF
MAQSLEGQRIGPYQISSLIGAGGMGEVYKARDTRLDRPVAIKVLPQQVANDPRARDRFEREARAIAALNHPHICTLYDIGRGRLPLARGTDEEIDFLVMEYLEGQTLRGPLPVAEAVRLATEIASALDAAHRQGILHRDLKPGNVMVTKAGVKLLDFGLAKLTDAGGDATRTMECTVPGAVLGTVAYMSPEQAEGRPLDERSDVFSFGALLYEMLAGRRAFEGDTTARVTSAVLRDAPLALQTPPALDRIVRRCLAKEPSERFPAMADVKTALEQVSLKPAAEPPSIAVLPFANMSPDPDNEYFSDGISEEIINALTQIEGLHVAARTSSFSFKGKSVEVGDIAKRLSVRHVLEGSVRKAGDRVRVTAQLVDASNGYQLWSERYDRQLADIFDVQDEIAHTIVRRLKVALAAGATSRLVKATTSNMEAYQHYLKGRAMLYRRGPWNARALESFQRAVGLDSGYAQAWAGVADAYTVLCYSGDRRPGDTMPAALDAATRATVGDPGSAEAHNALAIAALLWERDLKKAEREFLEALALSPQYMQARCWYGLFFLQWGAGRLGEGLTEAWRAFEADPLSSYATMVLSLALVTVGRFEDALLQARAAVQHDPESFVAQWELGCAYHWNGQDTEAIAVLEPLWAQSGHNWVAIGLVPTYANAGTRELARRIYDALLARREPEYVPPFVLAVCASALGDHEAAIAFCEAAIVACDMLFAVFHRWLPDFEPVRTDPRFADLLARFNTRRRTRP